MTATDLLAYLRAKGVEARTDGSSIRLRPRAAVTPEDCEAVGAMKVELLKLLGEAQDDRYLPIIPAPAPAARVRYTAEALPFLAMSLDEFQNRGALLEIRVPWLPASLWMVPAERDVAELVADGVGRGRIWTVTELMNLMTIANRTTDVVRTLTHAKLELDGEIACVRAR